MGLRVTLGLKRLFQWETTDAPWLAALQAIVETGAVDQIRDVVQPRNQPARHIEARRTPEAKIEIRELSADESSEILAALQALHDQFGDPAVSFSWEEAEFYGTDIQDLALPFAPSADPMALHQVRLGDELQRLVSLERSLRMNWYEDEARCDHIRAMHQLARTHSLIVHSA